MSCKRRRIAATGEITRTGDVPAGPAEENAPVWRPHLLGRIAMLQWKARFTIVLVVAAGLAALLGKTGLGDWLYLGW